MRANFKHRTTSVWDLDFKLCHIWREDFAWEISDGLISHIVYSFFQNDPYYPRPADQDLWQSFSAAYRLKVNQILAVPGKDQRPVCLPSMRIVQWLEWSRYLQLPHAPPKWPDAQREWPKSALGFTK